MVRHRLGHVLCALGVGAGLFAPTGCSSDGSTSSHAPGTTGGDGGSGGASSPATIGRPSSGGSAGAPGSSSGSSPANTGGASTSGGGSTVTGKGAGGANGATTGGAGAGASGGTAGAAGTNTGGTAGTPPAGTLAPARGALLGEYYGDGTIAETDARIGRKPAIHLTYFAFSDDFTRTIQKDFSDGEIPLVNWEPDGIDFHDITSGNLDATIEARAAGSKALGKPFFLDFAAEMNGDEAWSGNDAPLYVSAYRHIHDVFVAQGATNVVWAWCPNVTDVDGRNTHTLDYYPGDDYVDWTGVDGYNWGSGSGFTWQSFHDVFARIYPILAGKGKPILIGEMASDENGGDKGAWVDAIVPTLKNDFPMIRGLVWFDVHKERSWQINSSPASLAAYQKFAQDPYMNP